MNEFDKPIIVPWDFSEVAEFAMQHALLYSKLLEKEIVLVHIVKKKSEVEEFTQKMSEQVEELKKKYGEKPNFIVKEGSIFTAITEVIEETDATLAIMGTHGLRGMQKLTGSWALKVITGSKAPFVVVQDPPTEKTLKTIVLPIDFKTEEKEKLVWANFLNKLFNCKFYVCYLDSNDPIVKKRTQGNLTVAIKYLTEKGIDYEAIKLPTKGSLASDSIKFAKEISAGMIVVMTTKNLRFQDYVLGADEQAIIANMEKIPVMCINPRPDLRKLGGFGN